jgi:hypothetical protein
LQGFSVGCFPVAWWRGGVGLWLRSVDGGGVAVVDGCGKWWRGGGWHGNKTILSGWRAVVAAAEGLRFRGGGRAGAVQRIGMVRSERAQFFLLINNNNNGKN